MTGVRNPLKVLCDQGQAEPRARINPTFRVWGHLVVFTPKTKKTKKTFWHAGNYKLLQVKDKIIAGDAQSYISTTKAYSN